MEKQELLDKIKESDEWAIGAMLTIYRKQTSDEQDHGNTVHENKIGFSGADASIMSSMSQFFTKRGSLTEKQLAYVRKIIPKYTRQMLQYGVTPVELKNKKKLTKSKTPAQELKATATEEGRRIEIKFIITGNKAAWNKMLANIKTLSGRAWQPQKKCWICPISFENIAALKKWGFELDADLKAFFKKHVPMKQKAPTKKQKNAAKPKAIPKTRQSEVVIVSIANKGSVQDLPKHVMDVIKSELTLKNPIWLDNYIMGRYNGKTAEFLKLYNEYEGAVSFPAGFTGQLCEILETYGFKIKMKVNRNLVPVEIEFKGKLRPFQVTATDKMLETDMGTLQAATGAGKTVMALNLIAQRKQKTLVIVHTKELAHQWIKRATTFLHINKDEIGLIGDGQYKIGDKLTVGLVQSIYKRTDELKNEFGFIVVDECHRVPSRMFTEAVSSFYAAYILGLSATPFRSDKLDKLITWFVGPLRHEVEKAGLIEKKYIVQPIFKMKPTSFRPVFDPIHQYSKMLSELTMDEERNKLIVRDIINEKDSACLILSDRKAHCEDLMNLFGKGELLTGSIKTTDREEIIRKINSGESKHLFATGQLIGEGFDCDKLNALFLVTPIKYAGRITQYIGRIMRPGDRPPVVYDYVDERVDVLVRSSRSRIKVYGRENLR